MEPAVELVHSGKVRDLYADGDDLILVASDRVSVYDVVLPTPIPDKGAILTQLSLWWFERLADLVPHHVISAVDVPAEFAERAIRRQRIARSANSAGTSTAEMTWWGTRSASRSNHHSDSWVRMAPLSGIGVGSTTS